MIFISFIIIIDIKIKGQHFFYNQERLLKDGRTFSQTFLFEIQVNRSIGNT